MASNTPCGVESSGLAATAVAAHTQMTAASRPIQIKKDCFCFNCPRISSFVYNSSIILLAASLFNSPQKERGAQECDHRPGEKNNQVFKVKVQTWLFRSEEHTSELQSHS